MLDLPLQAIGPQSELGALPANCYLLTVLPRDTPLRGNPEMPKSAVGKYA